VPTGWQGCPCASWLAKLGVRVSSLYSHLKTKDDLPNEIARERSWNVGVDLDRQ
jgi:hypothetical protein